MSHGVHRQIILLLTFLLPIGLSQNVAEAARKEMTYEEGPDLVVSLHSHEPAPALRRPVYVPAESQEDIRRLAEKCYALLAQRNLPHATPFAVSPEGGRNPASFNLTSALHHVCGAGSFTFECPHGLSDGCPVTLEQILDIQLTLYEALLQHAVDKN
jgi:hypothetical protein